jgi:hypothetical protein
VALIYYGSGKHDAETNENVEWLENAIKRRRDKAVDTDPFLDHFLNRS